MIDIEVPRRKRTARAAGACYMVVAILGGFAELFVRARVYVPGDAAATAEAYRDNVGFVRAGIVADLVQALFFLSLAMLMYQVLRHVDRFIAATMVVLVAISVGIISLNMVFQQVALLVATGDSDLAGFDEAGQQALVLLLSDIQYNGYLIAGIFFALWLVPFGYLAVRSELFPRVLGLALMVGCAGYLIETFTIFLAPALGETIDEVVTTPGAFAEISMALYLVIVGCRTELGRATDA